MKPTGFKEAKKKAIECLQNGNIRHESERADIDVKNLLHTGAVTPEKVAEILGKSRGDEYKCSPHHSVESIEVHIVTRRRANKREWYIKWYFIEPNTVFISVHN